jgi:predicted DNA-binding transcriptional regulator AlpA
MSGEGNGASSIRKFIYGAWKRLGQFPKRVQLSAARHGWAESEIDDWIAARMASRRVETA